MLKIILRKDTDDGREEELPIYSSEVSIPNDRLNSEYENHYSETSYATSVSEALADSLLAITCFNMPCVVIYEPYFDFNDEEKKEVKQILREYFK